MIVSFLVIINHMSGCINLDKPVIPSPHDENKVVKWLLVSVQTISYNCRTTLGTRMFCTSVTISQLCSSRTHIPMHACTQACTHARKHTRPVGSKHVLIMGVRGMHNNISSRHCLAIIRTDSNSIGFYFSNRLVVMLLLNN